MSLHVDHDLLTAGTSRVLFELTSRCNLKCVYCAVSQPSYHGQDLEVEHESIVAQTFALHPTEVQISGHGETTLVRGWQLLAREFLRRGLPLSLTTNLSKKFSAEEINVLCELTRITVSCDTTDPELFAKLRRGSKLDAMERNLRAIVDTCRNRKRQQPYIALNCTVMQQNIGGLVDVVRWAIAHEISCVSLVNLVRYPPLEGVMTPQHPADVDPQGALEKIAEARRVAREEGLDFNSMGGLETELKAALSNKKSASNGRQAPSVPALVASATTQSPAWGELEALQARVASDPTKIDVDAIARFAANAASFASTHAAGSRAQRSAPSSSSARTSSSPHEHETVNDQSTRAIADRPASARAPSDAIETVLSIAAQPGPSSGSSSRPNDLAETRDCVDPWEMTFIRADGRVALCCWSPHLGNLKDESLASLIDSPAARKMRAGLLSGELDDACRHCPARGMTTRANLAKRVRKTIERESLDDVEKLRARIYNLEGEREQLLAHAETLESEREHLKGHIANLEPDHAGLRGHVETLEHERGHLLGHIRNLERERSSITWFVVKRVRANIKQSALGKFFVRIKRNRA
jgi:MoaA/NifB/PqqE/SkfB family radical SAM enzyme